MHHLILLGDSILDNASYTEGGPAVITHVQEQIPKAWQATLLAVDGSTTEHIADQIREIPSSASHLLLSVGGNNALLRAEVLEAPVSSSGEALILLSEVVREFEASYRMAVKACLSLNLPLVVCTIYHGNFPDPSYQRRVIVALALFNDVIIRVATENRLKVIDLRLVCSEPEDYANPIEPSASGGAKIAQAIVLAVTEPQFAMRGASVVAA
jgi:hypothetical protein